MVRSQHIVATLIALTIPLGLVPYQSQYCGITGRRIDGRMMTCCLKHHQPAHAGQTLIPSGAVKILVKPTLGALEFSSQAGGRTASSSVAPLCLAIGHSDEATVVPPEADIQRPPPNIIIRNLNIRI